MKMPVHAFFSDLRFPVSWPVSSSKTERRDDLLMIAVIPLFLVFYVRMIEGML